jgi:hypothetical protein
MTISERWRICFEFRKGRPRRSRLQPLASWILVCEVRPSGVPRRAIGRLLTLNGRM